MIVVKKGEKYLEKKLCRAVRSLSGEALKFSSPYHRGMPDRIVLLPGGKIHFVELKSPGKHPTDLQRKAISELRALGFDAVVIDNDDSLNEFLKTLKNEI